MQKLVCCQAVFKSSLILLLLQLKAHFVFLKRASLAAHMEAKTVSPGTRGPPACASEGNGSCHLEMLQWARGVEWNERTHAPMLLNGGHLEVIWKCCYNGWEAKAVPAWNNETCASAWRSYNGWEAKACPWDARTCAYAAEEGHLKVLLQWLRSQGLSLGRDEWTCSLRGLLAWMDKQPLVLGQDENGVCVSMCMCVCVCVCAPESESNLYKRLRPYHSNI